MKILIWTFQLLLLYIIFIPGSSIAQTRLIKGTITDSATHKPVADVTISIIKDNKAIATAFSDNKGSFFFDTVPPGNYLLYTNLMGYQSYQQKILINKSTLDLGNIKIINKSIALKAVEIKQTLPPISIKTDTLEFNAGSFKTQPNAVVEELLKKVPGISIDPDGKIKAQGQAVKRILVDGKPFFGDNVVLTTKNLPAEIIDKIQLIDGKSDQAQFSGFDDGNTEKIINITLKKNRRRGTTANTSLGLGTTGRYAASSNINSFNENDRLSGIANGNNLNDPNFNPGNNFAGMLPGNGIATNLSGAVNYNLDNKSKLKLDASYAAASNNTQNNSTSARQTFLPDTSWYYNQQSANKTQTVSHDLQMRLNYKIDNTQSLLIAPHITYNTTNAIQENHYQSLNSQKDSTISGSGLNTQNHSTPNINIHSLYRKKFKKKGQTFSADLSFSNQSDKGDNTYHTNEYHFPTDTLSGYLYGYDRRAATKTDNNNLGMRFSYTTPVLKDRYLEVSYSLNNNSSKIVNHTYDLDSISGKYEHPNDSLSNTSENSFFTQSAGLRLRTNKCGYDYTFGMNVQYNMMNNENSNAPSFHQRYINLFPTARLHVTFSKEKAMIVSYEGNTIQPSIQQLQPLPNLSNSLLIQEGNPDLKPAFQHNMSLVYNAFNRTSFRGMFLHLTASIIQNKIVSTNRYDTAGRQYTKPINANGAFTLNTNVTNHLPLKSIGSNLSFSTGVGYNRDITFTYLNEQNIRSFTHNFSLNEAANFNYRYKSILELNTALNLSYNGNRYGTSTVNSTNYLTYNLFFSYNIHLPAGFMVGNDVRYIMNRGKSAGFNTNVALLNGFIAKSLFKQKQALIKLYGYDLLHQNVSITRNASDNFIEDVQQTVLKPYLMLSFTWFLKNYPAGKVNSGSEDPT